MLHLEDKISVAIGGPIKAGKEVLVKYAAVHRDILFQSLAGNFWVPPRLNSISTEHNQVLFELYSADPQRYSLEFQYDCLANCLVQQTEVNTSSGLVLHLQPLEIDRHIYAEANRDNMGTSFSSYVQMYEEVRKRVTPPDVWIYLRVPEENINLILERIRSGGRKGEQKFLEDPSYILDIIRRNEHFFKEVVRQPVITLDATHAVFSGEKNDHYVEELYRDIAAKIRTYKKLQRLPLGDWEAVDHNQSQKGMREARRQLRKYLADHQTIITIAGLVGSSKTGTAELLSAELNIDLMLELSGKHNAIADELLTKFLRDKKTYAYPLQKSLISKRINMRRDKYASGNSFVEDRSPVEDQSIFWRQLHQQRYLSDEQMEELGSLAKQAYTTAPKSDLMIKLIRTPEECREMILRRGRREEIDAWPIEELRAMEIFYHDIFQDMDKYGSHQGPTIDLKLEDLDGKKESGKWDAKNTTHWGYLFQEILLSLLERDGKKK